MTAPGKCLPTVWRLLPLWKGNPSHALLFLFRYNSLLYARLYRRACDEPEGRDADPLVGRDERRDDECRTCWGTRSRLANSTACVLPTSYRDKGSLYNAGRGLNGRPSPRRVFIWLLYGTFLIRYHSFPICHALARLFPFEPSQARRVSPSQSSTFLSLSRFHSSRTSRMYMYWAASP